MENFNTIFLEPTSAFSYNGSSRPRSLGTVYFFLSVLSYLANWSCCHPKVMWGTCFWTNTTFKHYTVTVCFNAPFYFGTQSTRFLNPPKFYSLRVGQAAILKDGKIYDINDYYTLFLSWYTFAKFDGLGLIFKMFHRIDFLNFLLFFIWSFAFSIFWNDVLVSPWRCSKTSSGLSSKS